MDKLFVKDFLTDYISQEVFSQEDTINKLKNEFLSKHFDDGKFIYKFYSFSSEQVLNKNKIDCLKKEEIWCSPFYKFDDKTEFYMKCNINQVSQKTGYSIKQIEWFLDVVRELNDLSSFTFSRQDYMWEHYANNGNGFCVQYEVKDCNYLMPILYEKKDKFDFTDIVIDTMNELKSNNGFDCFQKKSVRLFADLPLILKDDKQYYKENEIRVLTENKMNTQDENRRFTYNGYAWKCEEVNLIPRGLYLKGHECDFFEELLQIAKNNNYSVVIE